MNKAHIVLQDGSVFSGYSFGAEVSSIGEMVFNTGMTGYQEILSDPSYYRQILCMTYPIIGNYGINRDDYEAIRPYASGMIVREYCDQPSNWRAKKSLGQLLQEYSVPGICEIDTRKLTRLLRAKGNLLASIEFGDFDKNKVLEKLAKPLANDHVAQVSTASVNHSPGTGHRIVVLDFGVKRGILRDLSKRNCEIILMPYNSSVEDVMSYEPDGILLSNGPGDPRDLPQVIKNIKVWMEKLPIMGICLGHQLLALAAGCKVLKLKFGHHGCNQPVKDLMLDKCFITSQNHNFAVDPESLLQSDFELSHIALNDNSVEGMRHKFLPIFSVQYHPEASPGPHDSSYLFDEFIKIIQSSSKRAGMYAT